jgi:hypothetical protein
LNAGESRLVRLSRLTEDLPSWIARGSFSPRCPYGRDGSVVGGVT